VVDFFASGRAVDLILILMALETTGLLLHWRLRAQGVPPLPLLINMTSGACLLLAVRAALTGAPWGWVGLFLVAALVVHLADLAVRWQERSARVG
jgi:hypothetical protein